jgi:type I restriction enzyme S subunit
MPPTEFKDIAISELGTVLTGRTPPNNDPDYFGGEVDFLTPTDMGEHRRLAQTDRSISDFGAHRLSRCLVPRGVAVSCIGWQMGKAILVDRPTITNQQINSIIVNEEIADLLFVYYALAARRKLIFSLGAGGSRTPILNKGNFQKLTIKLPPLPLQKRISAVFGSLDDKIELNQRTNETLEALVRAMFRDWFVDFGPTRRMAAGESDPIAILGGLISEPVQAAKSAALFPKVLRENGLPDGWPVSTIGDEVETLLGGTPARSQKELWGGDIPWINSGKANEFRVLDASEYITDEGFRRSATKLLPKRTTLIAITGATLGQVSLNEIEVCANQSIVGVIGNDKFPSEFVYCWIKENINTLISAQTGGAQQHINKNNVNELSLIKPSDVAVEAWRAMVLPLFDLIASNCVETRTLAATRDLLLPKLISGEIRLKDMEGVA